MEIRRVFLIVLDSVGCGELPDAADYGDQGSHTLRTISQSSQFSAENMEKLGLFHIPGLEFGGPKGQPEAAYGRMAEQSAGKDTTTGHWEICGLVSKTASPTYPEGFPEEVLEPVRRATGRGVLCNRPYSGTDVIRDYGKAHIETGDLIVYTSADSVFQIAAHEDVVPLDELYRICELARGILKGEHAVGRVIARPFTGSAPDFTRTANRHDFALAPPRDTLLDLLSKQGKDVIAIGKINDIFAGSGVTRAISTKGNRHGMEVTKQMQGEDFTGLCFTNLVDFDMLYGHRNDTSGYAAAFAEFDRWLPGFLAGMGQGDVLIITADHGCDPGSPGTDHTREYVPLLVYGPEIKPADLGTRTSFADLGKTIAALSGLEANTLEGTSFHEVLL